MKFGTTINPTLSNSSNTADRRSEHNYHSSQLQHSEKTGSLSFSNSEDSQDFLDSSKVIMPTSSSLTQSKQRNVGSSIGLIGSRPKFLPPQSSHSVDGTHANQSLPDNASRILHSYHSSTHPSSTAASAPSSSPAVFPRSLSEACFDSSASKFRQLPCRTFISVGTCPYRERCVYLHDPRCICKEAKTKTRRKNKEDVVLDSLFWPVMPQSMVNEKLDSNGQPHVIQAYSVPQPQNDQYQDHDRAVYSMWMHFVDSCLANQDSKSGAQMSACYSAPNTLLNRYTNMKRLPTFLTLSRGESLDRKQSQTLACPSSPCFAPIPHHGSSWETPQHSTTLRQRSSTPSSLASQPLPLRMDSLALQDDEHELQFMPQRMTALFPDSDSHCLHSSSRDSHASPVTVTASFLHSPAHHNKTASQDETPLGGFKPADSQWAPLPQPAGWDRLFQNEDVSHSTNIGTMSNSSLYSPWDDQQPSQQQQFASFNSKLFL